MDRKSLRRIDIATKYGCAWRDWSSVVANEAHGISLWKHSRNGWERLSHSIQFKVGSGAQIQFWEDVQCGEI